MPNNLKIAPDGVSVPMEDAERLAGKGIQKIRSLAPKLGAFISPDRHRNAGLATAEAERHQRLVEAQTDGDVAKIKNGKLVYDADTQRFISAEGDLNEEKIVDMAYRNVIAEEIKKQINLHDVLLRAEQILEEKGDGRVNDDPIDPDWFEGYRGFAEKAQREEMKDMWAKVLAGEAENPGTFSLRTFQLIQNLTAREAELICKCLSLRSHNFIVLTQKGGNLGLKGFLDYGEVLELESIGVISGDGGNIARTIPIKANDSLAFINNDKVMVVENGSSEEKEISCNILMLTGIGQNLADIHDEIKANSEYLKKVGLFWESKGFQVALGDTSRTSEGHIVTDKLTRVSET